MRLVAYLIFGLMPLAGLAAAIRVWRFVWGGVRVRASIAGYREIKTSQMLDNTETTFLPIVTFHDEKGNWQEVELSTERPLRDSGRGENTLKIIYPRGRPKEARIDSWMQLWLLPIGLCTPAVLLLIAFLWLVAGARLGF